MAVAKLQFMRIICIPIFLYESEERYIVMWWKRERPGNYAATLTSVLYYAEKYVTI